MTKEQYLLLFQNSFQPEKWELFLKELLPGCEIAATPKKLEEGEDAVKEVLSLGLFETPDHYNLGLFTVQLKDKKIARNRVGLNKIIAKYLNPGTLDGALVAFYDTDQPEWRFSYLAKANVKGGVHETAYQRFTYVFGTRETHRTAIDQFIDLERSQKHLKNFQDAFNVEALSDAFYKGYRHHYEKFVLYLTGKQIEKVKGKWEEKKIQEPHEAMDRVFGGDDKKARDFLKKLLGRLVFLHFLQKKGWLGGKPQFLSDLFQEFKPSEQFHSIALKQLFFSTLNEDRKHEKYRFQIEGKDPFTKPCAVPYLNGGLFENDLPEAADLDFPADYFEKLLYFFSGYNFTIDENDPLEQEVGIDPEMLGRIFENLLEENRKKGTYYTPKDIVQYMCQESLIRYLMDTKDEALTYENLSSLVVKNQVPEAFTKPDKARQIHQKLVDVKICDPAIGSGAFPMGLLKELFECRRLLYAYLKTSDAFVPGRVKKEIIQNNIYGVDLDPGAVDIARLRFWLALVVDEEEPSPLPNLDYKIMQGNSLLESFEGISLLVKEEPEVEAGTGKLKNGQLDTRGNVKDPQFSLLFSSTKAAFDEKGKTQIKKLADQFFTASPEKKKAIRQKIDEQVVKAVKRVIEEDRKKLDKERNRRMANYLSGKKSLDDAEAQVIKLGKQKPDENAKVLKLRADLQKLIKQRDSAAIEYQEGMDKEARLVSSLTNPEKPYFMWHLFFGEIFSEGPEAGFDIMIGNPPYRQLAKMKDPYLEAEGYETYDKTGDLYCLFYEKGLKLLRPTGMLAYITSNSWLQAQYGESLRRYFVTHSKPEVLLNFEDAQVFKTAIVEANILLTRKGKAEQALLATVITEDYTTTQGLAEYCKNHHSLLTELPESGWHVGRQEELALKQKIESLGKLLKDWPIEINYGIKTGLNEAFILDKEAHKRLLEADPKNANIIKPTLRGRDLKRYSYQFGNEWMIVSHNGIKEDKVKAIEVERDYPMVFEHLKKFLPAVATRSDQGKHWSNLRNCAYQREFEKPKIIWGELSDEAKFTFDEEGYYVEATTFLMTGQHLKYLLAVLNSKAAQWYFEKITTTSGMGTNRWKKYKIELLPVPVPTKDMESKMEELVNQVLVSKKQNPQADTKNLENQIDALVYSLYGLSNEDIDRVEGRPVFAPPTPLPTGEAPDLGHWVAEINQGESKKLEFKSTLVWDVKEGKKNPAMEHSVLKTLAAFMNSEGGVLYIGVTDEKEVFGLEADKQALGKGNADGVVLHVDNLVKSSMGMDKQHYLSHTVGELEGKEVIRFEVQKAKSEVWLTFDKKDGKGKQEEFYIRSQASSIALQGKELSAYVKGRF